MKKIILLCLLAVGLVFMTTPVMAITYTNSGQYLGTFGGNVNDIGDITDALESLGLTTDCDLFSMTGGEDNDFDLGITYGDNNLSGTWFTDGTVRVGYYAVKAGPQFALYLQDPSETSGTWSTEDLLVGSGQIPQISHLAATGCPNEVPEPATLILLGLGLLGIAGIRRKK